MAFIHFSYIKEIITIIKIPTNIYSCAKRGFLKFTGNFTKLIGSGWSIALNHGHVDVRGKCWVKTLKPINLSPNWEALPPGPPKPSLSQHNLRDGRWFRNMEGEVGSLASHLPTNDSYCWNCTCIAWGCAYTKDGFFQNKFL